MPYFEKYSAQPPVVGGNVTSPLFYETFHAQSKKCIEIPKYEIPMVGIKMNVLPARIQYFFIFRLSNQSNLESILPHSSIDSQQIGTRLIKVI